LSTPVSSRLRPTLQALGTVAAVYLLVVGALQVLVRHVESTGQVYPYRQEDWLRYLLPTLWPADGQPLILLTGPSNAREGLLVEEFASAFPGHRVFQGSISAGTLADVVAALAYVEAEHGTTALPGVIVIGFSTRFVAEIPRTRPFAIGLNRYSGSHRMVEVPVGPATLQHKPYGAGALSRLRFLLLKQGERYAAAAYWLLARSVTTELDAKMRGTGLLESPVARLLLPHRARQLGLHAWAVEQVSPYKYRGAGPEVREMFFRALDDPRSYWPDVWEWNAAEHEREVVERLGALRDFASSHGIELYAVNLPEGSANRVRYHGSNAIDYRDVLLEGLDTLPVLDLRCLLDDDAFVDAEHARVRGAREVTRRVIEFVQDVRSARAAGLSAGVDGATWKARAGGLAAGECPEYSPHPVMAAKGMEDD
jgi:hypothetical protein